MKHSLPISYSRGFSLPEILVSLFLVSFVIAALGGLLREAVRFYTDQSVTLEVQKNCIIAMQRMGKELREASVKSLNTSIVNRVTIGSPRDQFGNVVYDDGRLLWHKFVRFSIQNIDGSSILVRDDDLLDGPSTLPPDTQFADFSAPDRTAIQARHIEELKITLDGTNAKVELKAGYNDIFDMTLETEIKLQN